MARNHRRAFKLSYFKRTHYPSMAVILKNWYDCQKFDL